MPVTASTPSASTAKSTRQRPVLYAQALGQPRAGLVERMAHDGVQLVLATDAGDGLRKLAERPFASCVVDLAGERAAVTTLRLVRARHPALPILAIVDPGNASMTAEALQAGVTDLLPWPFAAADLAAVIGDVRDRTAADGNSTAPAERPFAWFLGSPAMRRVADAVAQVAASRAGVAVCGERGSGRERVARAIHAADGSAGAFVAIDGARQEPDAVELAIFGVAGDKTSPIDRVTEDAALIRARGGTLFIANVVELPARLQARLARLVRDREAHAAPGRVIDIDVRLVVSLTGAPEAAVADGRLRAELADRLATRIDVPALRERREDIPALAVWLAREACARRGEATKTFSRAALTLLGALTWPGNAAELADVVDRSVRTAASGVVQLEDVLAHAPLDAAAPRIDVHGTLREARMCFERECIAAALVRHRGRVGEAAKALGIQRTNLYRKVRQLKVDKALLSPRRA